MAQNIAHIGTFRDPQRIFQAGDMVTMRVNEELRRLHARLHSAGHLIDVAMERIGYQLEAGKGSHTPQMSFVEYIGSIPEGERESARVRLQEELDRLIGMALPVEARMIEFQGVQEACGFVPDYLPADQPVRVVTIEGFRGCPCGGTHVTNTQQIVGIKIVKLQNSKKNLRVKYELL
eukprot:TRINITY_DN7606_c0_g1_i5.p1 TRINITY_DN7606_c0_g1~~TRINITY_DN7606_c0_g1_i5.p1  ORF type:complete len:177 (-),score=21.71 TRINITY_DN7606_c0_g1_i5:25-555(-)